MFQKALPITVMIGKSYGRGGGVGRGLGVNAGLAVGEGLGVKVGVGVGVGLSAAAQYLPPVLSGLPLTSAPPQTIISPPLHTAV